MHFPAGILDCAGVGSSGVIICTGGVVGPSGVRGILLLLLLLLLVQLLVVLLAKEGVAGCSFASRLVFSRAPLRLPTTSDAQHV